MNDLQKLFVLKVLKVESRGEWAWGEIIEAYDEENDANYMWHCDDNGYLYDLIFDSILTEEEIESLENSAYSLYDIIEDEGKAEELEIVFVWDKVFDIAKESYDYLNEKISDDTIVHTVGGN